MPNTPVMKDYEIKMVVTVCTQARTAKRAREQALALMTEKFGDDERFKDLYDSTVTVTATHYDESKLLL